MPRDLFGTYVSFVLISIMPSTLLSILPCLYSVNYLILRWKLFFECLVFHAYKIKLLLQLEILFFTGGDYALSSSALSYMLACIASRFNYGLAFVDDVDFKVQFASFSYSHRAPISLQTTTLTMRGH